MILIVLGNFDIMVTVVIACHGAKLDTRIKVLPLNQRTEMPKDLKAAIKNYTKKIGFIK